MVRLIVDDAGNRRAFNVGEGRLSVGSGTEAKLKLTSPGVASLHVDIEIHGGKATLHPKPGVTAPQLLGRAATGPVVLQHGVPVKIGGATVTVEYEGLPSKIPPVAPAGERSPSRVPRRGRDDEDDDKGPGRRPRKQGVPTWVWIAACVPIIAIGGWFISSKLLGKNNQNFSEAGALADYNKALEEIKNSRFDAASKQLDRIPADAVLEPTLATRIAKMREEIKVKIAEGNEYSRNEMDGQKYFSSQLENFVNNYMSGKITPSEARVFMKRAKYFREKWPTHSELAWVNRQEERFKDAVDLTQPPSFDDIQFEVESLTWSHPRNYKEAFAAAKAFQATATGPDVEKVAGFLHELEGKRADWFKDRLEQARWHFDRKEEGLSIGVLLSIIRGAGDEAMADNAAERLLAYGNAEKMASWLRGYRTNDPDGFAEVSKNRVIAAFLKTNKL
ncbi:MAG TPA: FHA domain-containing protein [Planctomycetota bacterium]|nr:FHA domain-containing protein [Planctomycetota bacterium]